MDRYSVCATIASVGALLNTPYYAYTIIWGPTRPPRSSYWIWSVLGIMLLTSYLASGGTNWYLNAANSCGTGVVALLSVRYGDGKELNGWDRLAIRLALVSLPLWIVLRFCFASEVAAGLAFGVQMFADAAAGMPMLKKCWERPELESKSAWVLGTSVYAVNLFAVRHWTPQDILWNGWLGGVCLLVTIMLFTRPHSKTAVVSETT